MLMPYRTLADRAVGLGIRNGEPGSEYGLHRDSAAPGTRCDRGGQVSTGSTRPGRQRHGTREVSPDAGGEHDGAPIAYPLSPRGWSQPRSSSSRAISSCFRTARSVPMGISPRWFGITADLLARGLCQISWLPLACRLRTQPSARSFRVSSEWVTPGRRAVCGSGFRGDAGSVGGTGRSRS